MILKRVNFVRNTFSFLEIFFFPFRLFKGTIIPIDVRDTHELSSVLNKGGSLKKRSST